MKILKQKEKVEKEKGTWIGKTTSYKLTIRWSKLEKTWWI